MLEHLTLLSPYIVAGLSILLFLILAFEFINGFHDTANAVATVIYTNAMRPSYAVIMSGIFNFLGVLGGGLAVAYSIVNLLPTDLLTFEFNYLLVSMLLSIIIGAIIWNFGTWFLAIPVSSSHTLIGAIIGVAVTKSLISHNSLIVGVNWDKAFDIGLSLLFSPLIGFFLAFLLFISIKRLFPRTSIHESPDIRTDVKGKKHPPFWTRFCLILSAVAVSYAHGSNDGQKGVGLFMLVLLCFIPATYVLDLNIHRYDLERSSLASIQLTNFVKQNEVLINKEPIEINNLENCETNRTEIISQNLEKLVSQYHSTKQMSTKLRWETRNNLLCVRAIAKNVKNNSHLSENQKIYLSKVENDIIKPVEFAPLWVIFAIAAALGLGTVIGWKRVSVTIGEGIGKSSMTYAQGVCAQIITALSIAGANIFGLPVSTTQILSSAVSGTAVANKSGLNKNTVKNIILTWILTFPIAMILSGSIFFVLQYVLSLFHLN